MQYVKIELPIQQAEVVMKGLYKLPYEEVEGIVANIRSQAQEQMRQSENKMQITTTSNSENVDG